MSHLYFSYSHLLIKNLLNNETVSASVVLLPVLRFRVTPMSSSQVRSSDAYVLFYELASSRM